MSDTYSDGIIVGDVQGVTYGTGTAGPAAKAKRPGFEIPWSWLSLTLLVIAITSLGTLSVVVSVKNVDVLSTIALALAVLAFAAQLIVSLAQAQGSAQQLTQTERVNSETQSALAEVRSTAHSLLANQSDQFNKVLSALLRSATEDAVREVATGEGTDTQVHTPASGIDPEVVAERVEVRVRQLLSSGQINFATSHGIPFPAPLDEGEGEAALNIYRELTPEAVLFLCSMIAPGKGRRSTRAIVGAGARESPTMRHLLDLGILYIDGSMKQDDSYSFTPKGRLVARLLGANHVNKPWFRHATKTASHPRLPI